MLIVPVTTVVAQAAPTAAPTAASTASPTTAPSGADAAVTARAKDWFHQIQTGKIDRSQLNTKMNTALTDTMLANVSSQLAPLGDPTALTFDKKTSQGTIAVYVFKVQFPSITLYETFAVDPDGKIAGLYLGRQ